MLAVVLLSQYRISSSKTVRPRAPCGARCIGQAVSTWSANCSEVPHSQFGEGTPVRRRLSLTQASRGKPIPTGLEPVPGTNARSLEAFSQYSAFHLWFVHSEARMPSLAKLFQRFKQLAQTGVWILVSLGEYLRTHLKHHTRYDRSQEIHGKPRRVSLPVGEAQLARCLSAQVGSPLKWDAGIQ